MDLKFELTYLVLLSPVIIGWLIILSLMIKDLYKKKCVNATEEVTEDKEW